MGLKVVLRTLSVKKGIDIWDGLDIGGVEEFVGLGKGFQSVSQI